MNDQRPPQAPRWPDWPMLALAFAGYCALAVIVTFPLVLHLTSRLPKDAGDPLIAASLLWWNANVAPLSGRWWDGPGFFPLHGTMAFSADFLGASLIATPLQWAGLNATAAYNLTFLASFPLCAIAAHALGLTLTRRHDAALVCGLAFGFNPFRVAHIEHLELLMAFGMPVALVAMHRYVECRQRRWLAVLAAALAVQALSSAYYALFFTVFFALWIVWFMRPQAWRELLAVGAAGAAAVVIVSPVVAGHAGIHATYNWRRDLPEEVLTFSADVSSLITASPLSAMWGWTSALNGPERQLFPGLTITALAMIGMVWASRAPGGPRDRWSAAPRLCWSLAAVFTAIAIGAAVFGPWELATGWLRVSVTTPYKPLSVGAAFAVLAVLSTARLRAAFRHRSPLAFYLIAAAVLFACSFGPKPTLFGERVLYEPPYAWLMRLPFFGDTIRAPARFGMLAILGLSVAAALAFHRLSRTQTRKFAVLAVAAGIVFDGWIQALPLAPVPPTGYAIPHGERPAALLELPLGDVWRDIAAVYRSTQHGVRVVNGYNGFEPIYYQVLRRGLADRDPTILDALATFGPIVIAADRTADADGRTAAFLAAHPRVTRLRDDANWTLYTLSGGDHLNQPVDCAGPQLAIAGVRDEDGVIPVGAVTDQNPATRSIIASEEDADDAVVLDFGSVRRPCRVEISMGEAAVYYPGSLEVSTSTDAVTWETPVSRQMAGSALLAALADPRDARVGLPLPGRDARFIRLRAAGSSELHPWAIAEITVQGASWSRAASR